MTRDMDTCVRWALMAMGVTLLLLITAVSQVTALAPKPVVKLEVSKLGIREGDTLTVKCTVTVPSDYTSADYLSVQLKREDCHDVDSVLTRDGTVEAPYATDSRYTVSFTADKKTIQVTLTISSIKLSEGGFYQCKLYKADTAQWYYDTTSMPVLPVIDVAKVILQQVSPKGMITNLTNGATLSVEEGPSYTFKCMVIGGYPYPEMDMLVGDASFPFSDHNTRQWHGEVSSRTMACAAGETSPNWLPTTFVNVSTNMDTRWNQKLLTCTAKMTDVQPPQTVRASVTLHMFNVTNPNTASNMASGYHLYTASVVSIIQLYLFGRPTYPF